jgi:ketosteroid isomerase-like protein
VKRVAVRGWPWNTSVLVEWADRGKWRDGVPYENEGAHAIHIRWGKADYIHAYLDTEKVTEGCRRLADNGIEAAAAPPITD